MSRQYLLATLPAPVTPKCRGIVSGRKESAASTPISVTKVRIIIMPFCFLLIKISIPPPLAGGTNSNESISTLHVVP